MTDGLSTSIKLLRREHDLKRSQCTLLKSPIKTLYCFYLVLHERAKQLNQVTQKHMRIVIISITTICLFIIFGILPTPLRPVTQSLWWKVYNVTWWVFLGFLSSFGLGTGLHTFVLYLGPFIARTTITATKCQNLTFDRYGANRFICRSAVGLGINDLMSFVWVDSVAQPLRTSPSSFSIWCLVAPEAFLWGLGTAIGEIPPYFVARTARIASERLKELPIYRDSSDDMQINHPLISPSSSINAKYNSSTNFKVAYALPTNKNFFSFSAISASARQTIIDLVGKIGFFAILLFASIPNPLFDLAGLTCGHILIPFTTFFLATLIGKAFVKVTIQTFFVIIVFNPDHFTKFLDWITRHIPFASVRLKKMLDEVHQTYKHSEGSIPSKPIANTMGRSRIFLLWDLFLIITVAYFIMSFINSTVQEYWANQYDNKIRNLKFEYNRRKPKDNKVNDSSLTNE